MSSGLRRRDFLWLGTMGLVTFGCASSAPTVQKPVEPEESKPTADQEVLTAAAEALVPSETAAGAYWAEVFLVRRFKEHPKEVPSWTALAQRLDAEARRAYSSPYPALSLATREAVIRALHPSLADEPQLSPEAKGERKLLRNLMLAFFVSDHLGVEEALALFAWPARSRSSQPPAQEPRGRPTPDVHLDRLYAMSVAVGDYHRAWVAAGYESLPGVCKDPDDYTDLPGNLPF